ncbi:serine/arginine repetitive matrix protein 1-like [Ctenocephalides felis]|uniref:serine/arginine repetitive matrix protein 1-like n=1 Tax=Ctenocephalides felis TaxID=7515 RepID=UPI000E6E2A86|nr:serine/arginine repetitive matrix protein 1-like [Ctenocephalides felis]
MNKRYKQPMMEALFSAINLLGDPKGARWKDVLRVMSSANKSEAVLGQLKKTVYKGVELGYLELSKENRIRLTDKVLTRGYLLEPEMVLAGRARRAQKNIKRRKSRRSPKRRPKRGSKAPKRRPKRRAKSSQRKGRGRRRGRLSRRAGSIPAKKYYDLVGDTSNKSRSTSPTSSTPSSSVLSETPSRTPSETSSSTLSQTPSRCPFCDYKFD